MQYIYCMSTETNYNEAPHPEYPRNLGATVSKFRNIAAKNGGLRNLDPYHRRAYGAAVEKAIRAKQRSELLACTNGPANPKCQCASGTPYNTGEEIDAAIKRQQASALAAYPSQVRRKRTDLEWQTMYAQAMKEKRNRK